MDIAEWQNTDPIAKDKSYGWSEVNSGTVGHASKLMYGSVGAYVDPFSMV
jgi:hypothetical protein